MHTTIMDNEKYMVLGFRNHEDFEICNQIMKVSIGDVGTSADGLFVVIVKTDRILIPHGTLIIKTTKGRSISVRVTSGVAKRVCDVTFD
jgi:hypothetical protein